jgi:hypothetical protein
VAAAKKAGLQVPIIITPVKDAEAAFTEPYLDTMSKLGLRYYQAPTLARYDYTKELQPQLDVWKAKIEKLAKLNEKYGTTAVFHVEGGAGNIGGGAWDLWLLIRDFDTKTVGMDFDLGHVVFKGGLGIWEAIRFMHKHVLSIASKDIRWAARAIRSKAASIRSQRRLAVGCGIRSARHGHGQFQDDVRIHEGHELLRVVPALQRVLRRRPWQSEAAQPVAAQCAEGRAEGRVHRQREARLRVLCEAVEGCRLLEGV